MKLQQPFLLAFIFILSFTQTHLSAQHSEYHRVKIFTGYADMNRLASLGIDVDHGEFRPGVWFITDLSQYELDRVNKAGFRTEIIIHDVVNHYATQNISPVVPAQKGQGVSSCQTSSTPVYSVPAEFSLGSMGGYFTYQEMLDNLDSMASKYPGIITVKTPLGPGLTIEGRPVYYVKVSDNVNIDEAEPEMLYTAVHHAREPGGLSEMIYYLWYLLENYSMDPEITSIVDGTEMFFIPCINPDGYIFNEINNPAGGGMWRKNRRLNADGTIGVDLNRNYDFLWGFDNIGSSPDGIDETYRGTSGFSEPELQLVRDFVNTREFQIALNYHTFGNLLIYPWGYQQNIYTPDSALFVNYGELLTRYNNYSYGTANQTVGYIVNGSSDDWMYGEQVSKPKIFAMTPEAGPATFGFWPPSSEIIGICQDNMFQNLNAALLTGEYASVTENSPQLFSSLSEYSRYTLTQLGLDTVANYIVSIDPVSPNILSAGTSKTYSNLGLLEEVHDSISLQVAPGIITGDEIIYILSIDNGTLVRSDTIIRMFGTPAVIYSTNATSTSGWIPGSWDVTSASFVSAPSSITDSPNSNYPDNQVSSIELFTPFDLSNVLRATLGFYARWEIEPGWDHVQVQASPDAGQTWISLCGKYTKEGNAFQVPGEPLYDGFRTSWVYEEIDLSDLIGNTTVIIRFVLTSDGFVNYDGFYFDDLEVSVVIPSGTALPESKWNTFQVHPIPAAEQVNIQFASAVITAGSISIHDTRGRLIVKHNIDPGATSYELDVSSFDNGIYYISFVNQDGRMTRKKMMVAR